MNTPTLFPILEKGAKPIPWMAIAPYQKQAYRNHGQTLERLAERGGLSYAELWFVMNDQDWDDRMVVWAREHGKELVEKLSADDSTNFPKPL